MLHFSQFEKINAVAAPFQVQNQSGSSEFSPEGASLGEHCFSPGRAAEDELAARAEDDARGVTEDDDDVSARGALDIHEVRVRRLKRISDSVKTCFILS